MSISERKHMSEPEAARTQRIEVFTGSGRRSDKASRKCRTNRGALPAHLPRIETIVDIEDRACPCCKGALHQNGEDVSERLDVVPAQFRVLVTRRPKYACRACEGAIVQAPAPGRLIEGGLPTEATVAHVLVSKYADHLPLYRHIICRFRRQRATAKIVLIAPGPTLYAARKPRSPDPAKWS
jgi:transposase